MNIYAPSFPNEPDWAAVELKLYFKCCDVISRFAFEHPNVICSAFGFYLQPDYTSLYIAIDDARHSLENAKRLEADELERRKKQFLTPHGWSNASMTLRSNQSYVHNPNTSDFLYWDYDTMTLDGWEEVLDVFLAELPSKDDPNYTRKENSVYSAHTNFMDGHALFMFWNVFERLIRERKIYRLNLATPFRLCFDFHDAGPMTVVRILNWPVFD